MHKESTRNHFIVPTADLCQMWQRKRKLNFEWYFSMLKTFDVQKVLIDGVSQKGEFSTELHRKLESYKIQPEYLLTIEEWNNWEGKGESLEKNHHFSFLIYEPLTADFLHEILSLKKYLSQMKFIVIARKDWNFRDTFRSMPHILRENLHVDFPLSTYPNDPFYNNYEIPTILSQMAREFRNPLPNSYCPNLAFIGSGPQSNIASISGAREVGKIFPKVSLITKCPDKIEILKKLPIFKNKGSKVEILMTRVAGVKTKVVPQIENVMTTRYWVHPINEREHVCATYLYNFSASKAQGDFLLFLDALPDEEILKILGEMLNEHPSSEKMTGRFSDGLLPRDEFFKLGGLDPAFSDISMAWSDLEYRASGKVPIPSKKNQPRDPVSGAQLKNKIDFELMTHKFIDSLNDFPAQVGKNENRAPSQQAFKIRREFQDWGWHRVREIYQIISRSSPKELWQKNTSHLYRVFSHFYFSNIWRMNPKSYKSFWKLLYLSQRMKWFLFKVSFPFRKVYYFGSYQYEKRVLGLHTARKVLGEK